MSSRGSRMRRRAGAGHRRRAAAGASAGVAARSATVAVGAATVAATALAAHAALNARRLWVPPSLAPSATAQGAEPPEGGAVVRVGRPDRPEVSVLVPARNEAGRIAPTIAAILASRGVDLELCVLDDGSTDGTGDVVREASGGDVRLRVLEGRALPEGWLGKPHACAQLADAARGDVLVFVDADVVLAPDGLARTVAALAEGPFDLTCPYPRQEAEGPGPRLVQPLLQWTWLTFLPLGLAARRPRPSLVAANGQLLACRRADYERAGGHAAVADAVLEDLELGRAFVRAGMTAGVVDGTDVATCRMYDSWSELREGYAKSLWAAAGSPTRSAALLALLLWLFVAPPVAALAGLTRGRPRLAALGSLGYAAGVASRAVAAGRTGGRRRDALWHPVSVLALGWITARSLRRRAQGTLTWRGRTLPGRGRG